MATSFNPRLRTGGDDLDGLVYQILQGFNPRLRTGGDLVLALANRHAIVSIHASAREATSTMQARSTSAMRFNPRLRTGGDQSIISLQSGRACVSIHASAREATG